jgi:uncharacterized RmlC-like cupin family protein
MPNKITLAVLSLFLSAQCTNKPSDSVITPRPPFVIDMKSFRDSVSEIPKENKRSQGITLNFFQTEQQTLVKKTETRLNKDADESIYILSGELKVTFSGVGEDTADEGVVILVPAGLPYSLEPKGNKPVKILIHRSVNRETQKKQVQAKPAN